MRQIKGLHTVSGRFFTGWLRTPSLALLAGATLAVSGCGTSGYVGGGISSLSVSAVTLDAGQSYPIQASMLPGTVTITWKVSGATCSGSSCGSVTQTNATSATYTAPSGISAPLSVTVTAEVSNTSNMKSTLVTVNPDPAINGVPPAGTVGVPYTATITTSGGTPPVTLSATTDSMPPGLSFHPSTGVISGTPTAAGTYTFTVQAVDTSAVPYTTTAQETITIGTPGHALVVINGNPPAGTVGTAYAYALQATGGVTPYVWNVSAGALPAGLSLNSNGLISGTPTTAGTSSFTAQVQDAAGTRAVGNFNLTINPAGTLTITTGTLPNGTVNVPYNASIGVSGGTGPYACTVPAGSLPSGLTLTAPGCVVSGTPTTAGTVILSVTATDSSSPVKTVTGPVGLTINPNTSKLSLTGTLPNGTVGVPYAQTIAATGGTTPYTYDTTAGALPAGLSLSSTGVISGTPTTPGANSFTVTVTDSENPTQSASNNYMILIAYPATPNDAELIGPYAYLFQGYDDAIAGVASFKTATVGSFTADGKGGISLGELDTNHQSSTATGTLAGMKFLGTYTIGAGNRGTLTITTLHADGTTAATSTYALAVKAPAAPATVATEASFIESDSNQLTGTKGSGSIFQQTSAAVAVGLTGSYVFGMSGDTPCLISCNASLLTPGPVAEVGEFTTGGGTVLGTGDANVATATLAGANLSGSYAAPDSNGRVSLTMTTAGEAGTYPTDFAVYMIDGTQAFVLSIDPHSTYALLAGSMQAQTQSVFSNASMTGNFVGYENASTSPGLVSATLSTTLNLSTATIFQATGAANGNCSVNVVTTGGVNALISALTNVGGSLTGLTQILGGFSTTGATTCAVSGIGRGTLQYPVALNLLGIQIGTPPAPRVFYLSAPDKGYFLETSYAAVGNLEPQTGTPFTLANTFTGTYVASSAAASSAAAIDTSGIFQSNGAGTVSYTEDLNVGVGTVNVIQLGTTGSGTYTTPNAYGQIFLGTYVLYAITPNRFVMVDTNTLTTSPSVILLY